MAATKPADAGRLLADIDSLEFYADEGNPALSYSFPLTLVQSTCRSEGRTRNTYRRQERDGSRRDDRVCRRHAAFLRLNELGRTYASLAKNDEETEFMADAVPGIVCYR